MGDACGGPGGKEVMVTETYDSLLKQLNETWDLLLNVDHILETAIERLTELRKDLRQMKRDHDETTVRRPVGMGASTGVGAGSAEETGRVQAMPNVRRKHVLRPG